MCINRQQFLSSIPWCYEGFAWCVVNLCIWKSSTQMKKLSLCPSNQVPFWCSESASLFIRIEYHTLRHMWNWTLTVSFSKLLAGGQKWCPGVLLRVQIIDNWILDIKAVAKTTATTNKHSPSAVDHKCVFNFVFYPLWVGAASVLFVSHFACIYLQKRVFCTLFEIDNSCCEILNSIT